MVFLFFSCIVAFSYLFLQVFYYRQWNKISALNPDASFTPLTKISVVVIARNEEDHIEHCIKSILQQSYPADLFEVIVVDDRSTDRTLSIVQQFDSLRLRVLSLTEYPEFIHAPAFKKSAVTLAVDKAKFDWIVVTDADCIHPDTWLRTIAFAKEHTTACFIAAPIRFTQPTTWIEKMQSMEMIVLMLITGAGIRSGLHFMANGANMSFEKNAFLNVNGYEGNFQYASGDDMFLIEKIRSVFPDKILFLKSVKSIVETYPKPDWNALITQRLRWAGKNKGLKSPVIHLIWMFVAFYHLMLFVTLMLAIFHLTTFLPFVILLLIKWLSDGLIVFSGAQFFKQKIRLSEFIILQFFYAYYLTRLGVRLMIKKQ